MEIKIKEKNVAIPKNNSTTSIKTINTSFSEIYTDVVNTSNSTDKNITETNPLKAYEHDTVNENITDNEIITGNPLIDKLPKEKKSDVMKSIKDIDQMCGIDILRNGDKFINKDNTINIMRILNIYGNKITSSDLDDVSKAINVFMDNGLIKSEDYYAALKWIATRQEAVRIKMQNELRKDDLCNVILKHRNNR